VFLKPGIVQQESKSLQAYFSLANVFMAIHPRTKWSLGVVDVKKYEPLQTDYLVKPGTDKNSLSI